MVLAHRGLPAPDRLENSAAAVEAAVRAGAHGCEVDLRLSADGVLVAAHDEELTRYGAPGVRVTRSAAADLPLARLPELVEAAGRTRLVLELKTPADGARVRTVRALGATLARLPRRADLVVSSFDARLLAGVRELGGVPTALLGEPGLPVRRLLGRARGHAQAHPHVSDLLADPAAVDAGLPLVPWAVDSGADVVPGCAGVITDVPTLLLPALAA